MTPEPDQPAAPDAPAPSRALTIVSVVVDLVVTAIAARFLVELGRELGRRERTGTLVIETVPPADVAESVTVIAPEPAAGEAADVDEGAAAP